jgi:putative hemolysin
MLENIPFLQNIPMLYVQLGTLVVLLGLSGFFSSYETAITTLSKIQVRQMVKGKKKNADYVQKLRDNINDTIITILIGNNLVNIGASALATIVATDVFGSSGVGMAIGLLTFFVLIFGEITPKAYATQNAEKLSARFAKIFHTLSKLLMPVIFILNKVSTAMIRLMGGKIGDEPLVTKESIKSIAEIGAEEGVLAESESNIIQRVVTFNNTTAQKIMTARVNVLCVDVNAPLKEVKTVVDNSHYSRIPVYDKDKDHIVGVLLVRDFLKKYKPKLDLKTILSKAYFVTGEEPIDKLLKQLQLNRSPVAIVVGSSGGFEGVVTIEDIMEELVGDIYDETDVNEHLLKHIDKKTLAVNANIRMKDIDRALKVSLPEEKVTTFGSLNEFILNKLGRIPKTGEEIKLKDVIIKVTRADKHRIETVQVKRKK